MESSPLVQANHHLEEDGPHRPLDHGSADGGSHNDSMDERIRSGEPPPSFPATIRPPTMRQIISSWSSSTESTTMSGRSTMTTVLMSLLLGLVSGSLYGFGRYSQALTSLLTHGQVQRLGVAMDMGNYIGHPLTGSIYDALGPSGSCVLAACIVLVSYLTLAQWTAAATGGGGQQQVPLWMVTAAFFGVGLGSGLGYIAGLGSTTKAFSRSSITPSTEGDGDNNRSSINMSQHTLYLSRAIALVAAGYGLSATLVSVTFHLLGGGQGSSSLSHFFLLWAILVAVVNSVAAWVFRKRRHGTELSSVSQVIPQDSGRDGRSDSTSIEEPLLSTFPAQQQQHTVERYSLSPSSGRLEEAASPLAWTSWKQWDYWVLLLAFACVTGCGLFVINNVSSMVQSLLGVKEADHADSTTGRLVLLLSISNVVGRIVMGSVADYYDKEDEENDSSTTTTMSKRTLLQFLALSMAIALASSAWMSSSIGCLTMTVGVVAFAYGGSWVLIVGILTDTTSATTPGGGLHFGKDYGLMAMGPAISGMIFNLTSVRFYQQHSSNTTPADDDDATSGSCVGPECYATSFWLTAGAAFAGYLLLLVSAKHSSRDRDSRRAG